MPRSISNLRFMVFVAKRFDEDGCFYRASALTYTTILSIVPLLAVSFAVLAAFPAFKNYSVTLQGLIIENFVASSGQVIQSYLQQFVNQAYQLSVIGLIFLAVTAISMFYTMEQTFNTIWRVHRPRRNFLRLILYWIILLLAPLMIGLGLAVSAYVLSLSWVAKSTEVLGISPVMIHFTSFLLTAIAFSALYIVVPNRPIPFRNGVISGIIAAFLFELAKQLFNFYTSFFPTYTFLYGALAAIPIFLVWIYVSWCIVLLGVEICYALTHFQQKNKS